MVPHWREPVAASGPLRHADACGLAESLNVGGPLQLDAVRTLGASPEARACMQEDLIGMRPTGSEVRDRSSVREYSPKRISRMIQHAETDHKSRRLDTNKHLTRRVDEVCPKDQSRTAVGVNRLRLSFGDIR